MPVVIRLFIFSLFAFLGLSFAQPAHAADFQASYEVDYTVSPDSGSTHVKQQITLTNQQPNIRANSYSLTLDNKNYQNLKAYDSRGALAMSEKPNEDSTTVTFTFNDRVVGVGNSLHWTIEYDSTVLAQKHGLIWDITIPRVEEHNSYEITDYTARLLVPKSMGKEHYVSPKAANTSTDGDLRIYTFNKEQVLPAGIVASFGNQQVFGFTLKYHLHNPNIGKASTEIALPPDIPGKQQIIYKDLSPKPFSMRTDADGNTLATYHLNPNQNLDVEFTGWARIDSRHPTLTSTKTVNEIPQELVRQYTGSQKFWETSDPELIKIAEEITDPDKPVVENVRAIYDYVTKTLQYNTARINKDLQRLGASESIKQKDNAVCMEYTDLFITLARIAGIPAREIDGYAYTANNDNQPIFYPGLGSDILHAWAQVYLPEDGWIMLDATWGSTTGGIDFFSRIDLNRIAFVIKGISSQSPYAAGSYKTNDEQDGDVSVTFSTEDVQAKTNFEIAMDRLQLVAGVGSSIPLQISNTGNVALYDFGMEFDLKSPLVLRGDYEFNQQPLLPGQTATTWLPIGSEGWFDRASSPLLVKASATDLFDGKAAAESHFTIQVEPFLIAVVLPIVALIAVVLGLAAGAWYMLHRMHSKHMQPISPSEVNPK